MPACSAHLISIPLLRRNSWEPDTTIKLFRLYSSGVLRFSSVETLCAAGSERWELTKLATKFFHTNSARLHTTRLQNGRKRKNKGSSPKNTALFFGFQVFQVYLLFSFFLLFLSPLPLSSPSFSHFFPGKMSFPLLQSLKPRPDLRAPTHGLTPLGRRYEVSGFRSKVSGAHAHFVECTWS